MNIRIVDQSRAACASQPPPTTTAPDLTVDGVTVSSASVVEGASFTINATVNNEGNAASAATTLTYYRSANDTISTEDTSIATDPIGILAASGSSTQNASVSIADDGTYYVGACVPTVSGETNATNNCSTGVQVTVTAPAAVAPQITTQPTDQSVTVGDDATFTVAATGTPTPSYQWRFDGSDISGATSASYTLSSAALTNAGDYTVVVTNTAGTVTSTAATLTVTAAAAPSVDISIANGLASEGNDISFPVTLGAQLLEARTLNVTYAGVTADLDADLESSPPTTLTLPTGTTTVNLVVPTFEDRLAEPNETFTVTLSLPTPPTNPRNTLTITTATATGTIGDDDSANIIIDDQTKAENEAFRIGITTTSARNSEPVNITWTVTSGTTNGGSVDDDLDLTASTGSITLPASVGENRAEVFLDIPIDDDDINENDETFTLALTANGTAPRGVFFGTSSSAVLTITDNDDPTAAPDLTVDSVSVSSASVVEGISFTISATVNNGGNAASAATTLTYYRSADATITTGDTSIGADVVDALAANGSSPETEGVSIATAGTYYVGACVPMVSDETNTTNNCSTGVQVTVTAAPPTAAPDLTVDSVSVSSASVVEGATFTINAIVNNGGNAASALTTLTWYRSADATITTDDTSLTTDTVQTLLANGRSLENVQVSIATAGTYYVGGCVPMVSGETNTDNNCSTGVQVTVTAVAAVAPQITTQPTNQSVTVGGSATFTVAATGTPTPTYQWRFEGSDIAGATSASYTLSNAALTNAGDYTVVVTNTAGTVTSSAATLTVTATAPSGPDLTVDSVSVSSGSVVAGAAFTINAVARNGGNAASAATTLTYYRSTDATITTGDTSIGTDAVGALAASGFSAESISVSIATAGTYYVGACVPTVSGETNTDNNCSTGVQVTVTAVAAVAPQITTQPTNESVTVGGSATFTVAATGTPTPTYQWRFEGSDIAGATSASYTLSNAALTNAGDYTVVVTNTAGTVTSSAATLTVTAATVAPQITTQPTNQSVTVGGSATFTVAATGTPTPTYQWRFEGSDISGATSATYTLSSAALTNAGDYTVVVTNTAGTVTSTAATLTVTAAAQPPTVNISIANASATEGDDIRFTVTLSAQLLEARTLNVSYTAGTGTNGAELGDLGSGRPATLTLPTGVTTVNLDVPTVNDTTDENNETFTVTLSLPAPPTNPRNTLTITRSAATGTITDNDGPTDAREVEIVLQVTDVSEADALLTFRPGLTAPLEQDLVLSWSVTGRTTASAASAADFSQYVGSGTVTIEQGQGAGAIHFMPLDDDLVEGDEYLTVTLSPVSGTSLPNGVRFRRNTVTATIADTDEVDINLRVVADVSETDARLTFRPELTARLTQDSTLAWEVTGGTASAEDFSEYVGSGTVTVEAGRGGAPIRFMPLEDDAVEGDETLEVTISVVSGTSLPRGVNLGTTTTATATITDSDEASPAVDISIANARADEGDNIRFTVTLSDELLAARTLDIGYTAGTGDSGASLDDLGADRPTTLTLPAGVTTVNLDVPTVEDTDAETDEIDETFTVTLSLPDPPANPANTLTITTATATGTIVDDDAPAGDVIVSIADARVGEGDDSVTLTARLSRTVNQDVMLGITYQDGTATVADDLSGDPAPPRTVRIPANNLSADFTVFIRNDTLDEPDEETLTVSLGGTTLPPETNFDFSNNSATLTIVDDDDPAPPVNNRVSVVDPQPISEGAGALNFVVSTQFDVNSDVVLGVAYAGGTTNPATPADDLGSDRPTTVTINAGERRATLRVPITDDGIVEGNETFTVALSLPDDNPPGHTLFLDANEGEATGAITDNDAAEVTLGPATLRAAENGTFTYTVSLSAAADEAVIVRWTATAEDGDTATVADDLQATTNTVTFAANDNTAQAFTISPNNDNEDEDNETFTVTLEVDTEGGNPLPTGVTIGTASTSVATIIDNDGESTTPTVEVSIDDASAAEGATIRFPITLSAALTEAQTLNVAYTAGSASLDDLGSDRPTTLTLPTGTTDVTLEVPTVDDDSVEESEAFTVTLSSVPSDPESPPPANTLFLSDPVATGTITDNDEAPPPPPGDDAMVDIGDATVGEGSGNAMFTVTLSRAVSSPVVLAVTYTDGSAEVATDLGIPLPPTVTIAADTLDATLAVPIIDDDLVEGEETFTVTLSEGTTELPDGVTIADGEATGTITDNDMRRPGGGGPGPIFDPVRVSLSPLTATVAEDVVGGNIAFTVSLNRAVSSDVVLGITYAGGTDNPVTLMDDLGTLPTTVTIEDGDTSATLTLPIINDAIVEGAETFTVTLSEDDANPLPAGVSIGDGEATATIEDDDEARVALSPPTLSAIEGESFTYTVSLSAPASRAVTITWAASREAGDTATLVDDLQAPRTGTLTFAANNAGDKTFTIQPVIDEGDGENEEDETFTVILTATDILPLPTGVVIDTQNNRSVATIINNRPATVSIADADPVAEDAGPARFTVSLSRMLDSDVVLDVSYAARTAVLGDLGSPRPATVTLPANSLEATLEVPIFDDAIVEGAETFMVTVSESRITPLPVGVSITDGEATGTIALTTETSVLIEPRRTGAGTALRRHVSRFESMTGSVVQHRLDGRETQRVSSSDNLGSGNMAVGGGFGNTDDTGETGETPWGAWLNGAWTGFGGTASGRQADVYGGMDYLGEGWLIGGLLGYEVADLDIGEATYSANYTHVGVYGGARLAGRLLFDGAATYGMATPNVALGDVSASYKARRITARGAITGDFGLEYGLKNGSVTIAPQLGLLYARERLGGFTDSAGGVAEREVLELGRFSAGPRLIWDFEGGQVVGGLRMQGDFLQLDDGAEGRISGAANIGLRLDLTPNATLGIQGDVDGLGITDEFRSYGGNIELNVRF